MSEVHYCEKARLFEHDILLYKDDEKNLVRISIPVEVLLKQDTLHAIIKNVKEIKKEEKRRNKIIMED